MGPQSSSPYTTRTDIPVEFEESLSPAQRKVVRRCIAILGALMTGSFAAVASWPFLLSTFPLLLIGLSPIGRHLILVAPIVHPLAFIAVSVCRRAAFYIPCFFLGRTIGEPAIDWLETRAKRAGRFVRWFQQLFEKAPHLVVFLLPGPVVSTIAGSSGMSTAPYLTLIILGLICRMVATLLVADSLRDPIMAVLEIVNRYWLPATGCMLTGAAYYQWRFRRRPQLDD